MNEQAVATRQLLEGANVVPLTMALVHMTGDLSLLDAIAPYVRGAWDHLESVPPQLASSLRDRLSQELERLKEGGAPAMPQPDAQTIRRMMSAAVGEPVQQEYVPMLLEHMHLTAQDSESAAPKRTIPMGAAAMNVAVIGAGASGLCAAVRLGHEGISYTVFEKNQDVGGTWFENRYPGCAVDTPNHFYQFSFEPNNDWSHYFSQQPSIREYLSGCADKFGVRERIRFGCEVEAAHWQEDRAKWVLTSRAADGNVSSEEFDAIVCAVGQLNRPKVPDIPGLADFAGEVLHTAAWREDADLRGKRVALVGTGASAVQVGPAIVDEVRSLHVFQRSGSWVARRPNIDRAVSEEKKWALNHVPFYAAWYRFQLFWAFGDGLFEALRIDPQWPGGSESINPVNARMRDALVRHIRRELDGREDLIEKVIPRYPPFGKRVLGDAGWYRMLRREHVSLVDTGIQRIEPNGIRLQDESVVEVDAIIFATGFHAGRMLWPMDIRGRSGATIRETWGEDNPRAFLGITAPDFPNLFILFGPNTNVGHGGSAIFLAECQMRYTIELLRAMRERGARVAEVRQDVHDAYNVDIDERLRHLSWSHPSVHTWYKNASGRIITNQPWRLVDYWRLTHTANPDDYHLR
jgi:4-hydroxyacetophenone monooxygenase